MKQLSETLGRALNTVNANRPMGSDELTAEQRDAVGYFFARLKTADPGQYAVLIPSDKTRAVLSRTYAPYLKDYTRAQIDAGFDKFHQYRQAGESAFSWLNIDQLIGLVSGRLKLENEQEKPPAGIYNYFQPMALEDKTKREKDREIGRREAKKLLAELATGETGPAGDQGNSEL